MEQKPKTHEDLGLTKEEFDEVVDFFRELIRLDQRGNERIKTLSVLKVRMAQLKMIRKNELLDELKNLESEI